MQTIQTTLLIYCIKLDSQNRLKRLPKAIKFVTKESQATRQLHRKWDKKLWEICQMCA